MSIWTRFKRLIGAEKKMTSLELFKEVYGGLETKSGATVTWQSALEASTVLACVRVISNGISQVPFRLYQESDGNRVPVPEHTLYPRLYRKPNAWQTSFEFRETIMFHVLLTGNAYIFVNKIGTARDIRELIPIEPGRVEVAQNEDYSLTYRVRNDKGEIEIFPQDAIWHFRGPSWNTWLGMDAVKLAREAIGLSMSLEQGQADFQKNGMSPSANYAVTEKLSPEQFEFLSKWLDRHMPGGDRHGKPVITDMGAKFISMTMSAVDQQLIESRKHQIEEICREFGVMPIMVGHADKTATYASAEQMFLAHVVHTLSPWYQRFEQSADAHLLTERDLEQGYYTKFTPNALMRGAAADRGTFYAQALGAGGTKGWMTQNEVRAFEELDKSDDPEADNLPQPTNTEPEQPQA